MHLFNYALFTPKQCQNFPLVQKVMFKSALKNVQSIASYARGKGASVKSMKYLYLEDVDCYNLTRLYLQGQVETM